MFDLPELTGKTGEGAKMQKTLSGWLKAKPDSTAAASPVDVAEVKASSSPEAAPPPKPLISPPESSKVVEATKKGESAPSEV